jgi:hypothetical protein
VPCPPGLLPNRTADEQKTAKAWFKIHCQQHPDIPHPISKSIDAAKSALIILAFHAIPLLKNMFPNTQG